MPIEMVHVPAGSFLMGNTGAGDDLTFVATDELPQHEVTLSEYYIGKYEVTRGEYAQFIAAGGYTTQSYWSDDGWAWKVAAGRTEPTYWAASQNFGSGIFTQTDSHPVVGISYYEAEAFCNWAGGYLPTEAQWEKAARWTGTHPNIYPWGDTWNAEYCNSYIDSNDDGGGYSVYQTAPVGSYLSGASPYGCQDILGNAWEWCKDWYGDTYYSESPLTDPQGAVTSAHRILRGGSWYINDGNIRCSRRGHTNPYASGNQYGFRLVTIPTYSKYSPQIFDGSLHGGVLIQ